MANIITQSQYNANRQANRKLFTKLDILDFNFIPLNSIEGKIIGGAISIDGNSDIRRSCSLSFVVTDSSFDIQSGGQIWLDKYIQIYIGIEDNFTKEIAWNNMGIFLINQPTYDYDPINYTLSFEGVDLMAKLTGMRNGYISGLAEQDVVRIETGQNVREVIIGILKENGFNRYLVSECRLNNEVIQEVPYDMEFGQGSTWYDVLSEIRNIIPQYQIYFDVDGVFHYERIPYSDSEPIMISKDYWGSNVLSEQVIVDFQNVKNAIEVYGTTHDTEYFSDSDTSTVSGSDITLTVDDRITQSEYNLVAFVLPEKAEGDIQINVNNWGFKPLIDIYGNTVDTLEKDEYWVISYQADNWLFMGHLQAQGYYEDTNPDSPFYVNSSVGRIVLPLFGGEYENIQNDDLALERAKWEIYQRCRLNDTIRLTTIPIYWADVFWKVEYEPLRKTETYQYLTQSIHLDLSETGTQTWEMNRFYPYYPID